MKNTGIPLETSSECVCNAKELREREKESTGLWWIQLSVLPVCFLFLDDVSFHSIYSNFHSVYQYQYQLWEAGSYRSSVSVAKNSYRASLTHTHTHTHTETHRQHSSRPPLPSLAAEHMTASWHNTEQAEHGKSGFLPVYFKPRLDCCRHNGSKCSHEREKKRVSDGVWQWRFSTSTVSVTELWT